MVTVAEVVAVVVAGMVDLVMAVMAEMAVTMENINVTDFVCFALDMCV